MVLAMGEELGFHLVCSLTLIFPIPANNTHLLQPRSKELPLYLLLNPTHRSGQASLPKYISNLAVSQHLPPPLLPQPPSAPVQTRSQPTSVQVQTANILGFAGHTAFSAHT